MSETPDPVAEAVAPVAEPEIPAAEAPEAAAATETPETPETPAEGAPEASGEPEEPKKPKSPVAQLQGRVGHLTKSLHEKDAALSEKDRQIEAFKALLASQGKPTDGEPAPAPAPKGDAPDFQTAVQAEARRIAAETKFTEDCNAIFDAGEKAHGSAFKESVTNLNLLGLMNGHLVEAALATDTPADVIHYLGTDTEEAERITALPPIRMAAELVKLSAKLAAKPAAPGISRAPAPITPVAGAVKPEVDLSSIAKTDDMAAYVAARKQQGARFAQ